MESEVVPLLVSVTFLPALLVPTLTAPKLSDLGDSCTTVPVPVSEMVWVPEPPSSLIVIEPVLVPPAVGVKVTLIVQLVPGCMPDPQVFVSWKSPVGVMLEISNSAVPLFDGVSVCAALVVPTSCVAKVSFVAESDAVGVCINTEIPVPRLTTMSSRPSLLRSLKTSAPLELTEM